MINLKVFEKSFFKCFYLILLISLKLLHICMIWLSKSIRLSQFISVLSCTWKIKLDEIFHNSYNNVCLICSKKYSCDHHALKLHKNHTSDFNDRFIWYIYIFDTWSIIWNNNFCDKTYSIWTYFKRIILHE